VTPEKLDHVALFVPDPDAVAARLLAQLPFRVIESTDEFVLVGRGPEYGKLTLFRAPAPRDRGVLRRIGIGIPCGTVERTIDLGDGLELELVPADPEGEVDLAHVALRTPDPATSAPAWLELGFMPAPRGADGVARVRLGGSYVELHEGSTKPTERPLLNHLGLLVESIDEVERERFDVIRTVDAENSRAVFVSGPDGVEVEYIEHKPSFALA
jgi:catechol 2,3-dioxygenase-like lactoylglutathione lyase family enzyme